jgi:hypothetical protein
VLILESAPSFETRHLKRWLAEQGSAVAVRSLVSRGVYRYEHLNRRSLPLAPLTLGALVQFDLVVTDGGTLRALTGAERAALRSVVADSGRGLLLLPDEIVVGGGRGIPDAGFFLAAPAAPVAGAEQRSVRLAGGGPARAIPAAAARIGERFAAAAVLHDADGSPVAAVAPRGAGRVALTLVREPGRWLLAGDTESFAGYWSRLLTPLAAGVSRERWEVVQAHPLRVDEPVELVLTTAPRPVGAPAPHPAAFVTAPDGGRDSLHLIADPFDPARYRTTWWPRLDGWHRIESEGAALDVHVPAAGGGGTLMAAERLAATRRAAVMRRDDAAAPAAARAAIRPLSPLPLFLAFVAVTGALWVLDRRGPRHGGAGGMPPSGAVTAG